MVHGRRAALFALALALLAFAVFAPARRNGFLVYDGDVYVTGNPRVQAGLSWAGARWAFTTGHSANWHPLTWLSHMADVELWGRDPSGHHLTSLLIHAANTALLDVLSTLFALLTLLAYGGWARRRARWRYAAALAAFAAGLLAKPMLVTLPFVLVLLDVWPLRPAGREGGSATNACAGWWPSSRAASSVLSTRGGSTDDRLARLTAPGPPS